MDISNPYASPNAPSAPPDPIGPDSEAVSPGSISELARTKPWVRFLVVLGWFGVVALIAIGTGLMVMTSSFDFQGLFYSIVALIMAYPTVKMNRYASKIGDLVRTRSMADLESALLQQRHVWRFYAILSGLYLLIGGFVAVGIIRSMMAR